MEQYNGNGDGNNGGGNGYHNENEYGYGGYARPTQQPATGMKLRRGSGLALALVGALIGSVIGGGGMALYFNGAQDGALSAAQQAYIDRAVADAKDNLSPDADMEEDTGAAGTIEDTAYREMNLVTTDYSTTVRSVAEAVSDSVVGVSTSEGSGTGVIVSSDGLILTNEHVISVSDSTKMFMPGFGNNGQQQARDNKITVKLVGGKEYEAKVLYSDEDMDLAVIKIDAEGLTAAALGDSDNVSVGEIAIAIGNPLGLDQTVTSGIISALDVGEAIGSKQTAAGISMQIAENLIQTDAAINAGNSGGALLNAAGEIIGINSYKLSSGEGIGFAIPINAAKPIVNQIIATGGFKQAMLGVTLIDREILKYYDNIDITLDSGLYISDVDVSSDAYAQGLKAGDVITAIDGTEVNTRLEAKQQLYRHVPGDSVTLTVERDGDTLEMAVVLQSAE